MIRSLKLVNRYYRAYNRKSNVLIRGLKQTAIFILTLFTLSYIFYYIVNIHNLIAPFKYGTYDAQLIGMSPYQADKIQNYEFVDKLVTYTNIFHAELKNGDSSIGTSIKVLASDDLTDIDYTPYCHRLILERDESLMKNKDVSPIILYSSHAKALNVTIGDKITLQLSDRVVEFTLAGIYEDSTQYSLGGYSFALLTDEIAEWFLESERPYNPDIKKEDIARGSGFVTFNDREKGNEFVDNFIADMGLYEKYGENYMEEATPQELADSRGSYVYRERESTIRIKNNIDGQFTIIGMVSLGLAALIVFVIWEKNKQIMLTMQSISIFIASGCRRIAFFIYFLVNTIIKQSIFVIATIPIIKYLVINYFDSADFDWYLPWYLISENIPILLAAILIPSLVISIALYIRLRRKVMLFTGEE